jgi:signal transduction histidine kinase
VEAEKLALTNVARHSAASEYRVELVNRYAGSGLVNRDAGCGFDQGDAHRRASQGAGLGLVGMIECAELVGRTVAFLARTGDGTEVGMVWPRSSKARTEEHGREDAR